MNSDVKVLVTVWVCSDSSFKPDSVSRVTSHLATHTIHRLTAAGCTRNRFLQQEKLTINVQDEWDRDV